MQTLVKSMCVAAMALASAMGTCSALAAPVISLTGSSGIYGGNAVTSPSPAYDDAQYGLAEVRKLIGASTLTGTPTPHVARTSEIKAFYAGMIFFSAVPEPATWMIIALGMGMVGSSMRRRRIGAVRYAGRTSPDAA